MISVLRLILLSLLHDPIDARRSADASHVSDPVMDPLEIEMGEERGQRVERVDHDAAEPKAPHVEAEWERFKAQFRRGCGSCWAFASTGALEAHHYRKTGVLVSLSEQNLVDCSYKHGCNGGLAATAFQYVIDNGGIETESAYPYQGKEGPCRFKPNGTGDMIGDYSMVPQGDEKALMAAVATVGPVAVGIVVPDSFMHYESGVYADPACDDHSRPISHAVLVVGYGTANDVGESKEYWLIKNSWGAGWGESGYIRMKRGGNSYCRIADTAVFPTAGNPKNATRATCASLALEILASLMPILLLLLRKA